MRSLLATHFSSPHFSHHYLYTFFLSGAAPRTSRYLPLSLFQNHPMLAFHSLRDPTQISQPHVVRAFPRGPPISVPASRNRAGPSRPCLCPTAGLAQTPTHLPPPRPTRTERVLIPQIIILKKKKFEFSFFLANFRPAVSAEIG